MDAEGVHFRIESLTQLTSKKLDSFGGDILEKLNMQFTQKVDAVKDLVASEIENLKAKISDSIDNVIKDAKEKLNSAEDSVKEKLTLENFVEKYLNKAAEKVFGLTFTAEGSTIKEEYTMDGQKSIGDLGMNSRKTLF